MGKSKLLEILIYSRILISIILKVMETFREPRESKRQSINEIYFNHKVLFIILLL
jgi:hypothetical protein